jgi:hypothetical protein
LTRDGRLAGNGALGAPRTGSSSGGSLISGARNVETGEMSKIGRWVSRHISPSRPPRKTGQNDIFAMIPPPPTPPWTRNISMRPTWGYCSAKTRPSGCGSVFFVALPSGHMKIPGGRAPDPIRAKLHPEDPTGQVIGHLPAGKPRRASRAGAQAHTGTLTICRQVMTLGRLTRKRRGALDLPGKPIARACRRVHNHPDRIPLAGQRAWQQSPLQFQSLPYRPPTGS